MSDTVSRLGNSSGITEHLAHWGLRLFSSEVAYYEWQRQMIVPERLARLIRLAEDRQGGQGVEADIAFYDFAASEDIMPVVYSQRYGYYERVGEAVRQELRRLDPSSSVLDVGCGIGILTAWYASVFPWMTFRGIDRSTQSLRVGELHSTRLHLNNLEFAHCNYPDDRVLGRYDVIIATQALFQSETDPGLPSHSWMTFQRDQDARTQRIGEQRTGLGNRLECLLPCLKAGGTLVLFEKTMHLGRRVLFQRSLSRRGFSLIHVPRYLRYSTLGENEVEGPLYVVSHEPQNKIDWEEAPYVPHPDGLYRCMGTGASMIASKFNDMTCVQSWPIGAQDQTLAVKLYTIPCGLLVGCISEGQSVSRILVGGVSQEQEIRDVLSKLSDQSRDTEAYKKFCDDLWPPPLDSGSLDPVPVYENHSAVAQHVWSDLVGRQVHQSKICKENDGRARHIELGECRGGWAYLYWANTYDQRQLVIMESDRQSLLLDYYRESTQQE